MKYIIYTMKCSYFFFIMVLFSCSCLDRLPASITFPDKELEEIVVSGRYGSGGQRAIEALKKSFREGDRELKEGETIEEAIKNRYQHRLKEYFTHSGERYCYHKKVPKIPVTDRNLRARLYDKKEKMLTEDFLRFPYPDDGGFSRVVDVYLPYHDKGHEIRVVRLEGTKEIVLYTTSFQSHAKLLEIARSDSPKWGRHPPGIGFDTRDNCYVTPGPE